MSIASDFREKWRVVAAAADEMRHEHPDTRYAAMMQAADQSGHALVPKATIAGYHDALRKAGEIAVSKTVWLVVFIRPDSEIRIEAFEREQDALALAAKHGSPLMQAKVTQVEVQR